MALSRGIKTPEQLLILVCHSFDQSLTMESQVCRGPKGQHFIFLQLIDGDFCQGPRLMKVVQQPIKFITGWARDKTAPSAKVYGKKNRALFRPEITRGVSRLVEAGRLERRF